LPALKADQAWQHSRGAGVTVAIVNAGVQASHPDLIGRVRPGADFGDKTGGDATTEPSSNSAHGTGIASLIVANAANYHGYGLLGLAPDATILPIGVFRDGTPQPDALARGIRYAVSHGAKIIDVAAPLTAQDAEVKSAVEDATHSDTIVVSGVGDNGKTGNQATYPAAYPGVLAVTATDQQGRLWPAATSGPNVALAAPGVGILTASSSGSYWMGDSTNYAAAWVAAAAALLRAAHPTWTAGQVVRELITTADRQGRANDPRYGFGIVDPARALGDTAAPTAKDNPLFANAATAHQAAASPPTSPSTAPNALFVALAAVVALVVLTVMATVAWFI